MGPDSGLLPDGTKPLPGPVSMVSDSGLLPDDSKPLPGPMSICHQWDSVPLTLDQFHSKCTMCQLGEWLLKYCCRITFTSLRSQWVNIPSMTWYYNSRTVANVKYGPDINLKNKQTKILSEFHNELISTHLLINDIYLAASAQRYILMLPPYKKMFIHQCQV